LFCVHKTNYSYNKRDPIRLFFVGLSRSI